MSVHFPYRPFPVAKPLFHLGGRLARPRPVIAVTLIGPTTSRLVMGVLDTAADDTVFHESQAAFLGIDLRSSPVLSASGVGLVAHSLRLAEVTLRIADNHEQREWRAWVGFTAAPLRQPLLGFAGFLQFFSAHFHGDREEVELTVNSHYPGT